MPGFLPNRELYLYVSIHNIVYRILVLLWLIVPREKRLSIIKERKVSGIWLVKQNGSKQVLGGKYFHILVVEKYDFRSHIDGLKL